jgi:hypothetical protein
MAAGGFGQIPVKNSLGRVGDGWRMVRGLPRADLWQETGSGLRRRAGSVATGGTGRWSVCSGEATARTRPHVTQRGPMEPKGWLHSHGGGHRKGSRGGVHGRPVADQRSHRPSSACARTALAFYRWLTAPAWSPCTRKGGGLDRGQRHARRAAWVRREWRRGTGQALTSSCPGARAASGHAISRRRVPQDAAGGPEH